MKMAICQNDRKFFRKRCVAKNHRIVRGSKFNTSSYEKEFEINDFDVSDFHFKKDN